MDLGHKPYYSQKNILYANLVSLNSKYPGLCLENKAWVINSSLQSIFFLMQTSQSALLLLHLMHSQSEFSESLHTFSIKECLFPTTYIP